jgi:hypothetical protein
MDAAAATANAKVLLHPTTSRAVVYSSNYVATGVVDFHGRLGIADGRQSLEARRWLDAVGEVKDKALESGAEGIDAAGRLGNETLDRARSVRDKALGTGAEGVDAAGRLGNETLARARSVRGKLSSMIGERSSAGAGTNEKDDEEG